MERCPVLWSLSEEHDRFLRAAHGLWLPPWGRSSLDASIARYLKVWRAHILAHCRLEEEILLPELTPAISEADALVVFTTGDHLILRRLARDLAGCSPEGCQPLACRLAQKLDAHIRFEERTLFPALEATLGRTRLRELADELSPRVSDPASPPSQQGPRNDAGAGPSRAPRQGRALTARASSSIGSEPAPPDAVGKSRFP